MSYYLDKRAHQPTLAAELSAAVGRTVRVAQRPPFDGGEPGSLVVVDDATGDELDDLDPTTVGDVVAAHAPPVPPDPDTEFRDAVTAAVADEPAGSPLRKLAAALLGTAGPGAEPRRGPPA